MVSILCAVLPTITRTAMRREAGLKLKRRYRETHCISMFTSEYAVKGTRKFAHSLSQAHCAMKRVSVLMVDTRSRLQMLARLIRDDSINYRENIY